jgi:hypothetical protein
MLRIAMVGLGILLGAVGLLLVVGYSLPKAHVAARAILLRQNPVDVFALISNFKDEASWRDDLQGAEMLPAADGRTRFRERGKSSSIEFEMIDFDPPRRLVTQIADKSLPFGGSWTFEVLPAPVGTRLNITERGEIYNPVFRVVSRFILGYNRTLDTYLGNVSRKFGENAVAEEGTPAAR